MGLGGLGHVAVKLAEAMGADVTVNHSALGKEAAARKLGAAEVIHSKNPLAMLKHGKAFDFILGTIPVAHDLNPCVKPLKRDGHPVPVGALEPMTKGTDNTQVAKSRRRVAGSFIGSLAETREVPDFRTQHGITADGELIDIKNINQAFADADKGKVPHRFVIDMATLWEIINFEL